MCSVTGLIEFGTSAGEDLLRAKVRAMLDATKHRGPDGEGVYSWRNGALGHRRLAIVGSASDGAQPMARAGCVLSFNGMIYNHAELRAELVARHGARFAGGSDSEVVLEAYLAWGAACVSRFRGMWALALLDERREGELFLSRDRFGIKPLYYSRRDGRFYFASEIPAILAAWEPGWKRRVNLPVLADYLVAGRLDHRVETFFEGISSFPAGANAWLGLRDGKLEIRPHYRIAGSDGVDDEAYLARLEDAVLSHSEATHEVGLGLSGGLDSSTIAAISRKQGRALTALTVGSSDERLDETRWAKLAAGEMPWDRLTPAPNELIEALPEVVRHQGEPTGTSSAVLQFLLMRRARSLGIKIMLDGQGGDETLLGYERYLSTAAREALPLALRGLASGKRLLYFAYFQSRRVRQARLALRSRDIRKELALDVAAALGRLEAPARTIRELQERELTGGQLSHLLRIADRSSMAHGVEARLPFLDHPAVEAAVGLPVSRKLRGGHTKAVLRHGMAGLLPHELLWRRSKIGFAGPRLAISASTILESPLLRAIYREPVASFRNLELALWERELGATL